MTNIIPKRISIASDHAGFSLKKALLNALKEFNLIDLGCHSSTQSVDYPDFAQKLSDTITNSSDFGILICGSGIGISIAANRFKHIRAALCHNTTSAELSRLHNNANVLCLGARFIESDDALAIVNTFLTTEFEDGRHGRRVEKLSQ